MNNSVTTLAYPVPTVRPAEPIAAAEQAQERKLPTYIPAGITLGEVSRWRIEKHGSGKWYVLALLFVWCPPLLFLFMWIGSNKEQEYKKGWAPGMPFPPEFHLGPRDSAWYRAQTVHGERSCVNISGHPYVLHKGSLVPVTALRPRQTSA